MTGESKTGASRGALAERRQRLAYRFSPTGRQTRALRVLESEVWPRIPAHRRTEFTDFTETDLKLA